ncbi:MAG: hypothetical protein Q8J78_00335 [Moraxellaceae bacterium]|nr:hypothetical protein [Moraxellaceae bacterium]
MTKTAENKNKAVLSKNKNKSVKRRKTEYHNATPKIQGSAHAEGETLPRFSFGATLFLQTPAIRPSVAVQTRARPCYHPRFVTAEPSIFMPLFS